MTNNPHVPDAQHREESMKAYIFVFVSLMVLLALTVLVYYTIDIGRAGNLAIAMVIAVIKAAMVLMIFMHVRLSPRLVWVFATAAFLWLVLMIAGFEQDYKTRDWDNGRTGDSHHLLAPDVGSASSLHPQ